MRKWLIGAAAGWLAGIAIGWTEPAPAANAVIGSALAVRGVVSVEGGKGHQPLIASAPVHVSDTIVCAAGKAKIALNDGTIISIGENSRVRLADYDSAAASAKARVNLISGALRLVVDKITPAGRFEVETETAIAAVRGTDWLVEVTPERTSIAVVRGVVAVSGRAADGQASVVLQGHGQGTDVRRGSAPTPAVVWSAQRFADTLARATFE